MAYYVGISDVEIELAVQRIPLVQRKADDFETVLHASRAVKVEAILDLGRLAAEVLIQIPRPAECRGDPSPSSVHTR